MKTESLLLFPDWPQPAHVHACTTLCGEKGFFDLRKADCRQQLAKLAHLPGPPAWLKQTHSTRVVQAYAGEEADASFTEKKGEICVVLTADCLPILLTEIHSPRIAAIHAGWRGLAAGILGATLQTGGFSVEDTMAWLGPAISQKHFEVGPDVRTAFLDRWPDSHIAFQAHHHDRWMACLYTLATQQLHELGVQKIYGGTHCTFSESELFFSYRREKEAGRMATLIWMT